MKEQKKKQKLYHLLSSEFNGQRRNRTKRRVKVNYDQAKLNNGVLPDRMKDDPHENKFRRQAQKRKSVFQGILGNLGNPKIVVSSPRSHYNMFYQAASTGYKSKIPA